MNEGWFCAVGQSMDGSKLPSVRTSGSTGLDDSKKDQSRYNIEGFVSRVPFCFYG